MKKYRFDASSITVCGPRFPEGKTFPARYELQDAADMKRRQAFPIVHIFATVDEKVVKIDVPEDDEYYGDAYNAARNAAEQLAADAPEPIQADEQPASDPEPVRADEQPADAPEPVQADEQPASDPEPVRADEQPADAPEPVQTDEQPASDPEPVQADEQPASDPEPIQTDEQPADAPEPIQTDEQPADAPEPIQTDEQPADAPEPVQADEQPASDPKQAHGPVPEKTFIGTVIEGKNFRIVFDGEVQRTRVIIPAEHRDAARAAVEQAGFYYSAALDSWNKKLTFRAYRAAVALAAELEKVFAA